MQATKTNYSIAAGGAPGYPDIGAWNTPIDGSSTQQMEIPGIKRRAGANTYIYGLQGADSAAASGVYLSLAAPHTDAYTDAVICPIVFTALGAGTDNPRLWKAVSIHTCDTNTYNWYFIEGLMTATISTNTSSALVGAPVCVNPGTTNEITGATTATANGYALTTIACDIAGQVYLSLM